jgi:hypothetical protein
LLIKYGVNERFVEYLDILGTSNERDERFATSLVESWSFMDIFSDSWEIDSELRLAMAPCEGASSRIIGNYWNLLSI